MDRKEEFKTFAKRYPSFVEYVQNKKVTWQELYEMWDIYGDDDNVFSKYKVKEDTDVSNLINGIKNINMDNVQKNLNSLEKGIKMVKDLIKKDDIKGYEPRPIFKRFED